MGSQGNGAHDDGMTEVDQVATGAEDHAGERPRQGRLRAVWTAISGATGVVVGLAPHVLHHIGPLVGTALVAGAGGTALFGALGLLATIPLLVRLRRRFGSWWAPALALLVFTAAFVVSTTVIGPLISGDGGGTPTTPTTPAGHDDHH
jgi:hypothetical protein